MQYGILRINISVERFIVNSGLAYLTEFKNLLNKNH